MYAIFVQLNHHRVMLHIFKRDVEQNSPASPLFTQPLFGRRSKKTSKLRVTSLCVGNSPGIGEFPAQMVSNGENVPIWWRHHRHPISSKFLRNIVIWTQYIRNTIMISPAVVWYTISNTHCQTQSSQFCEVIFAVQQKIIAPKCLCLRENISRKYHCLRTRLFSTLALSWRPLIYNDCCSFVNLAPVSI